MIHVLSQRESTCEGTYAGCVVVRKDYLNGVGQLGTWVEICRYGCKWSAMLSLMNWTGYRTTVISHLSLYQSFPTICTSQIIFEKKLIMVNKVWAVLKNGKCKFTKNENNEIETQNEFW